MVPFFIYKIKIQQPKLNRNKKPEVCDPSLWSG